MTPLYEFREVEYVAPPKNSNAEPAHILTDATFTIDRGVFAVITGPSGAGKTTLLRLFNRLADPGSGQIIFDGKDIRDYPILDLRLRIGWVPQIPVRFEGTVDDNLRIPFKVTKDRGYDEKDIAQRIDDVKSLGLLPSTLFLRDAEDLSVGEAQRLNLLRALVLKPDILLLDEPTSALDSEGAEALLEQILRVRNERQLTAVMVSHRQDEVKKVDGVVLRIRDGKVGRVDSGYMGDGS